MNYKRFRSSPFRNPHLLLAALLIAWMAASRAALAQTACTAGPRAAGTITTVAGTGAPGFSGDGGPASATMLDHPHWVTTDKSGNLLIVDRDNQRIRRVHAVTGIITTIAGNGILGFSGDGGPATSATFADPGGVAADTFGNLFITDTGNNRVRRVDA